MNDQNEKMLFGKNVDKLINQRYQTVKQAAREIGYYRNDLTKVICGKKNFQLKTALKIAKYFNISVFLLFEYSRAAEPPVQCGVSHLSRRTEPHCL